MSRMGPLAGAIRAVVGLALSASPAVASVIVHNHSTVFEFPRQCAAAKLKSEAKKCRADLKAWAKWDTNQDASARDTAISTATVKLSDAFDRANAKAVSRGAECDETSLTGTEMGAAIDSAVGSIVTMINTGLDLTNASEAKCGAKLIRAAANECGGFLKAESSYFKKFNSDPQGTARDAAHTAVRNKFIATYNGIAGSCPTAATSGDVDGAMSVMDSEEVSNTTTSPDLPSAWTGRTPSSDITYGGTILHPICSHGTPYEFFFKRGTGDDVNKLLVYFQGGGACWDDLTCSVPVYKMAVSDADNPSNTTTGFADLTNPLNPFRNWSAVFVAYCTGDVHWGDSNMNGIEHRGFVNARVVEKFAREHFVNPSEVFVTGSSAGAYGAILHGIYLHEAYPASTFNVVADAGSGVITQDFLVNDLNPAWDVEKNLPTYIGVAPDITTLTIADLYIAGANYYATAGVNHYAPRGSRFGQYTTAYDGGGGSQTFFYNVMVNGIPDAGSWWHSTCEWNREMLQHSTDAVSGASNYRYYIGPGSRHTIWGSNRVYAETHGPVETFVDWLNDMLGGSPTWSNVACSDCSLLGSCNGGSNDGASCQHDAECPGGVCNLADAKPPFTCSPASDNAGASCQRDADCPNGACQVETSFGVCKPDSTTKANKKCSTDADCDGTSGSCVTEQPFQLDGVVTCP
ncbi:MAG: hypothetical protein DMF98_23955 [Acidobacteria bacterium]|nr:MAG: hypothetical protein DMF98_23955 [Acidobacteriota bacterium]